MSRIRGPYVRFCERDEAVTPHPTQFYEANSNYSAAMVAFCSSSFAKVSW